MKKEGGGEREGGGRGRGKREGEEGGGRRWKRYSNFKKRRL